MRHSVGPVALALGVVALSGCATGGSPSFAHRFVHQGKPAVDYGGPKYVPDDSLQNYMRKVQHLSARPISKPALGVTVESTEPRLMAALLLETAVPTAESNLRVAGEYRRLGLLDSAYKRLNIAVRKEPRLAEAHEGLARIWRDWSLPAEGLSAAYRAVYYAPESASAQNTLGTLLDALGRFDEARAAYERALALDPTAAWALNNLCYGDFRFGRLAEARSQCEAALRIEPSLTAAHNNLALSHAAAGDLEGARKEFLAAGGAAAAEYNLGIVHLAGRDYRLAADAFVEAIKARPSFTAAKARAHDARRRLLTGRN